MCAAARADERGLGVVLSVEADERGLGDSDEDGGEGGEDGEAVSWQAALRALLWSVYIPGTIRALGQMSLDPFVPLFAKRWGATVSEAGVVSSLSFAANALCSPVAGILVAKTGASCAMLVGVTVNIGAALLGGVSPSVFGLSVSRGLTGAGNGVFQVGRQVQLTDDVPNALRGRVQSLQGATIKLGTVVGPALGGMIAHFCGGPSPFFFSAAVHALTLCMLWAWLPSDPGSTCRPARHTRLPQVAEALEASPRLLRSKPDLRRDLGAPPCSARAVGRPPTLARAATPRAEVEAEVEAGALVDGVRRMLRTAPVVVAVSFAGSARSFLLPLKAAELKHGNAVVGLLYGFSFVFDVLCAPLGAWLMDRRGRKYSGVAMLAGSALGYGLLSQIRGRGKHAEHLMFAAAGLIGASSGLSVGLVATLGSDIAPVERRSEFLGCWKVVPLLGTLAGPLTVGSVAGHYSLNVASQFVSLLLAACALGYALFGLETLHAPHARRAVPGSSVELRVARAG